jgi:hypothetical protein
MLWMNLLPVCLGLSSFPKLVAVGIGEQDLVLYAVISVRTTNLAQVHICGRKTEKERTVHCWWQAAAIITSLLSTWTAQPDTLTWSYCFSLWTVIPDTLTEMYCFSTRTVHHDMLTGSHCFNTCTVQPDTLISSYCFSARTVLTYTSTRN